jgi:hypothetical protein
MVPVLAIDAEWLRAAACGLIVVAFLIAVRRFGGRSANPS